MPDSDRVPGPDQRRLVVVVVVVLALVVLPLTVPPAARAVGAIFAEPDPFDVVEDFTAAREAGDCERLADLVDLTTLAPGPDDDAPSRDEFLDLCPGVVDGFAAQEPDGEPTLSRYDLVVHGDRAEVDHGGHVAPGRLVKADGQWKVVPRGVFRLGRTPYQTVTGYLEAYSQGDCDGLEDHLSAAARSAQGDRPACEDDRAGPDAAPTVQASLGRPFDDEDDPIDAVGAADVPVTVTFADAVATTDTLDPFEETVQLVEEDLEWRIDLTDGASEPVLAVGAHRLATSLATVAEAGGTEFGGAAALSTVAGAAFRDGSLTLDDLDDLQGALHSEGFLYSADRGGDLAVTGLADGVAAQVRRFATAEGADRHARRAVALHREDELMGVRPVSPSVAGAEVVYGYVTEEPRGDEGSAATDITNVYLVAVAGETTVAVDYRLVGEDADPAAPDDDLDQAVQIVAAHMSAL